MKISAAIFDLNGTILDDEGMYDIAFNNVLSGLGIDASKATAHKHGIGVKENWALYLKNLSLNTTKTPELLAEETQKEYLKQLNELAVRSGFEDFVAKLKRENVKVGLATSNTWEVANRILEKIGLMHIFDSMTTAEEVHYNKPDPEIFLIAADKLGTEGEHCLVIEDSESGVEAGKRAGMKVIAIVPDQSQAEKFLKADYRVAGFEQINLNDIDRL